MSERTATPHTYSVRATFYMGMLDFANWRIRLNQSSLPFARELQRAFGPAVQLQSATVTVYPERIRTHFSEDAGQWQVQLDARLVSPVRFTRDEWIAALATAFTWAYRPEWVYAWNGEVQRGVVSDHFGRQGDPSLFVQAANRSVNEGRDPITYVGGSMLDLGPVGGAQQPATQPGVTIAPWTGAVPQSVHTGGKGGSAPSPQRGGPSPTVYQPPPEAPTDNTTPWLIAGGVVVALGVAAYVLTDD